MPLNQPRSDGMFNNLVSGVQIPTACEHFVLDSRRANDIHKIWCLKIFRIPYLAQIIWLS